MYSHIKVSKLNQCESNNQRCLPDTTKVASCIHKIFLPCIKPYKALLLVAFSHFKSSPSSNTRADEYSCFQQLASTTHYSTSCARAAIKDARICAPMRVQHWRAESRVQRWTEQHLWHQMKPQLHWPFWLQNKRWDDLKTGRLDWAKTPQDNFPTEGDLHRAGASKSLGWVKELHCSSWSVEYFCEKKKTWANQQHLMSLLICIKYFPVFGNNRF